MGFWNEDLFSPGKDKRKKLVLSDWSLMAVFAIITWILASIFAHLGGVNWVISQFVSAIVTGSTIFFLIGAWMYPTIAEIPIPKQGIRLLSFVLLGAFFFGFELHSGDKNLYQVIFDGFRSNGQWHRSGRGWGELGFIAAYSDALTISRYALWRKLGKR